jgi:hypothetical protein
VSNVDVIPRPAHFAASSRPRDDSRPLLRLDPVVNRRNGPLGATGFNSWCVVLVPSAVEAVHAVLSVLGFDATRESAAPALLSEFVFHQYGV